MSMYIKEHLQLIPLLWDLFRKVLFHKCSDMLNFSQPIFGLRVVIGKKASIHIFALGVASVVATNNAVGVDHGADPEFQVLSKLMGKHISREQKVYQTVDNKRAMRFT